MGNVVRLTCFNDDHQPAVALQEAAVERDGSGEIIHVVDHLLRRELILCFGWFWHYLTMNGFKGS